MPRRKGARVASACLVLTAVLGGVVFNTTPVTAQSNVMQRIQYGEVVSAQPVVIQCGRERILTGTSEPNSKES